MGGINLRDRHLAMSVPKGNRFHEQIGFELVAIEPVLPPVDARIAKQCRAKRAKAVCAFSNALSRGQGERPGMNHARADHSIAWHVAPFAAGHEPGPLNEVRGSRENRLEESGALQRILLVI